MRARCLVEEQGQRQDHTGGHAHLHTKAKGDGDGGGDCGEVDARISPAPFEDRKVNKAEDSNDDRGGERGLGQEMQQRRQEHRGQQDADGGESPRRRGFGTCVEVPDRAGKAPRDRIAARQGGGDIRRAEAYQLLIRVDPLALLRGQGLCDRYGFHKADDRDQKGRDEKLSPDLAREAGQRQRGQSAGNDADDGDALACQIKGPDGQRGHGHRRHRTGLGQQIGQPGTQARTDEQRFQSSTDPKQKGSGRYTDHQRDQVDLMQVGPKVAQQFDQ